MTDTPEATPPDDLEIRDEWLVLRRIPPDGYKASDGRPKSSPSFDLDRTGRGTSVTIWQSADDLANVLRGHDGYGVVVTTVKQWRDHGLTIARKVVDGDPNHCEIWGNRGTSAKRALAKAAKWQVFPAGFPDELKGDAGNQADGSNA